MSVVILLKGGKCDGTEKTLTQKQFDTHATTCKGQTYKLDRIDYPGEELPVFQWAGIPQGGGPTAADTVASPHTHKGWHDLRRSLNTNWQDALKSSESNQRAALRSLSRARKVRL